MMHLESGGTFKQMQGRF